MTSVIRSPRHRWSVEVVADRFEGQEVVVKRVPRDSGPGTRMVRRSLLGREARMHARIARADPSIVPRILHYEADALVLERAPGPDLRRPRAALAKRPDLLRSVMRLVRHLHSRGFAHGELRLAHLVEDHDRLILIDLATAMAKNQPLFRLARVLDILAVAAISERCFDRPPAAVLQRFRRRHPLLQLFFRQHLSRSLDRP